MQIQILMRIRAYPDPKHWWKLRGCTEEDKTRERELLLHCCAVAATTAAGYVTFLMQALYAPQLHATTAWPECRVSGQDQYLFNGLVNPD